MWPRRVRRSPAVACVVRRPTGALLAADNGLTDIRGQLQIDAGHFAGASYSDHPSMTYNGISIHAHDDHKRKTRPGSKMGNL